MDLSKCPKDNTEFAAQLMFQKFSKQKLRSIRKILKDLDDCLYKSYLKDLSLDELRYATDLCVPQKEKKASWKDFFPEEHAR